MAGRPTAMTDLVKSKLEEAFLVGGTDEEACFNAGISVGTLHNYINVHPEYGERKKAMKKNNNYQAKVNISNEIVNAKDLNTSKWWLEKKDKDFNPKTILVGDDESDSIKIDNNITVTLI